MSRDRVSGRGPARVFPKASRPAEWDRQGERVTDDRLEAYSTRQAGSLSHMAGWKLALRGTTGITVKAFQNCSTGTIGIVETVTRVAVHSAD
ncbi:hypothetical protein Rcae01_00818 [Novipirellula caenicola]|uniref:Uncharacterized protein n=1 Tax=Novipirellula caenicola TaxID=1536901 RepID=A0ABP9VJJ6_9BACT